MKQIRSLLVLFTMIFIIIGCSKQEAPVDSNGKTPQQVLKETYVLIVEGKLSEAELNFSPKFLDLIKTSFKQTFAEYCSNTNGWKVEWLRTELEGNNYNVDVWRVGLIVDEGKGPHNRPGVVQDFHFIDGVWKIVFWDHYPKT